MTIVNIAGVQMPSDKFNEISLREYFEYFQLKRGKSRLREKALDVVLDVRKFEIDLYWRRAAYFWTFIGASLTGFIAIQHIDSSDSEFWSVVVGCLGLVFSVAWYCVNRGSKQWQENWENHVDLLEDSEIGPLYKIVIGRPKPAKSFWHPKGFCERLRTIITGPGSFSVSKINQIVSIVIIFLWIGLIAKVLLPDKDDPAIIHEYVAIGVAVIAVFVICIWGRTDKNDYKGLTATKRKTTINLETKK